MSAELGIRRYRAAGIIRVVEVFIFRVNKPRIAQHATVCTGCRDVLVQTTGIRAATLNVTTGVGHVLLNIWRCRWRAVGSLNLLSDRQADDWV